MWWFFFCDREENRDVNQSKEHLRTMLTTREHNPSSHQPQRVLCRRQLLATRAPTTCSRTTLLLCMPKFSSISDSMRVPLGFGWTPEHSALWPTPKNARTGKLRLTNVHPLLQQGPPTWHVLPRQRVLGRFSPSMPWLFQGLLHPLLLPCVKRSRLRAVLRPKWCLPPIGPPVEELQTIHHHFQTPGTSKFVLTLPPASRQTLAAADSNANPRLPNTPTVAHAAR